MISDQEQRDYMCIAILQRMHGDEDGEKFSYGFDDIEGGPGYKCVRYFVQLPDDSKTLIGFGEMAVDEELRHVLIATMYPMPFYSFFFPGFED